MQSHIPTDAPAPSANAEAELALPRDPLSIMKALRDELRQKLLRDVGDFRVFLALERAIQSIEDAPVGERKEHRTHGLRVAVRKLLEEHGPLGTGDLIRKLRAAGMPSSVNSVSSSLSQSADIVNIRFEGRRRWWFANTPVPTKRNDRPSR